MGIPTSEVGYTSVTTGREDHEVLKGYVVALEKKNVPKIRDFVRYMTDLSETQCKYMELCKKF
jgi:hypothetical protein